MKKLMFATALVASAAAFADPINAISFEGDTAGATFANGATEQAEAGGNKGTGPYFYYDGDSPENAMSKFRVELKRNPRLCHLVNSTHRYTPREVRMIVDELGPPY